MLGGDRPPMLGGVTHAWRGQATDAWWGVIEQGGVGGWGGWADGEAPANRLNLGLISPANMGKYFYEDDLGTA